VREANRKEIGYWKGGRGERKRMEMDCYVNRVGRNPIYDATVRQAVMPDSGLSVA